MLKLVATKPKAKTEPKVTPDERIAVAISELNRKFGKGVVVQGVDQAAIVLDRLPTGQPTRR